MAPADVSGREMMVLVRGLGRQSLRLQLSVKSAPTKIVSGLVLSGGLPDATCDTSASRVRVGSTSRDGRPQ